MSRTVELSSLGSSSRRSFFVAFWALPASLFGLVLWRQEGVPLRNALEHSFVDFYTLGALSIVVDRATRRIRGSGMNAVARGATHVLLGAVVILVWKAVLALYLFWRIGPLFWQIVFEPALLYQLVNAALIYALVLSAIFVLLAREREENRILRETALELTAREAQLSALRAHLQPHFVFNALTAAMALIESDPPLARALMEKLADVMRQAFMRLERPFVTIGEEFAFIESYLAVERMRFGSRLRVDMRADPETRSLRVPPLILQPLVENAVKHGVATRIQGGAVRIEAARAGAELRLTVRDSGLQQGTPRAHGGIEAPSGRGLAMIRRRLEATYPGRHSFRFGAEGDGFVAEMTLPAEVYGG